MPVRIFDTLTKTKQDLVTRDEGKVSIYVCGPTVYDHVHIGNARSAIAFDVIRRYLEYRGFEVTYVLNHTDVDDKIIMRANEERADPVEVAQRYSQAYERLMQQLEIRRPDRLVKATDHIDDMIETIQTLIANGLAYESQGNVWYSVRKHAGYGKLSGRSLDDLSQERVEPDPSKKDTLDFALWKSAKPGEPSWPSPWGPGRPGWHIECSVMSVRYLGMGFDIHGGGSDLIFPHHENEIAQAEAAHGGTFVRYWLHNGMVSIDSEKMSKSLGNHVFAKDVLEKVSVPVVRLMSIAAQYRSDLEFSEASINQAKRAVERFETFLIASEPFANAAPDTSVKDDYLRRFTDAMDDDFNTPLALSVLYDLVKAGNTAVEAAAGDPAAASSIAGMRSALLEALEVFAIDPLGPREGSDQLTSDLIELALALRAAARKAGRFEEADNIRQRLTDLGVAIEDGPEGTRWRLKV